MIISWYINLNLSISCLVKFTIRKWESMVGGRTEYLTIIVSAFFLKNYAKTLACTYHSACNTSTVEIPSVPILVYIALSPQILNCL